MVKLEAKYIDKMFVIFPFEQDFYKQYDYKVHYVGNPLVDEIVKKKANLPEKEELFMMGYTEGSNYVVPSWINESTTVRAK